MNAKTVTFVEDTEFTKKRKRDIKPIREIFPAHSNSQMTYKKDISCMLNSYFRYYINDSYGLLPIYCLIDPIIQIFDYSIIRQCKFDLIVCVDDIISYNKLCILNENTIVKTDRNNILYICQIIRDKLTRRDNNIFIIWADTHESRKTQRLFYCCLMAFLFENYNKPKGFLQSRKSRRYYYEFLDTIYDHIPAKTSQ